MIKLGLYQHYKGNLYQVMSVARHSENYEIFVVYQALYGDYNVWIRPFNMFTETILIDGIEVPRFTFLKEIITEVAPLEKR
jgi:hypothetical protein